MKLSELVAQYVAVLPVGCVLTDQQIERHLLTATRFYCGCTNLASGETVGANAQIDGDATRDVSVSASELALIRPLWDLYMEKENSMALEASRTQGAELFGRAVSEVVASIIEYEARLPMLAFAEEWVRI